MAAREVFGGRLDPACLGQAPGQRNMSCLSLVLSNRSTGSNQGAHGQIGRSVQGDGTSSCGWGAFKEAGADPCSRTQPWISTPVWESPGRGPKLSLGELSGVLLLICPMSVLCSGICSWPALMTGQMGKYSVPERLFYVCRLSFFFLPCMCPKHCKIWGIWPTGTG